MPDKLTVPFFSNTEDNYHCFQAALRMVLAYFRPEKTYDWPELDNITSHTANYTWPAAGLLYCASLGLKIVIIDEFDNHRFAAEGYSYLVEWLGEAVAVDQKNNSNLRQEMEYVRKLDQADHISIERRIPTRADLSRILGSRGLVICNVNSCALIVQAGYSGHFVVVTGNEPQGVRIHDPGLPPRENMVVSWGRFERAWSYPNKKARNILGFYS
jgi:hypothetical protein